MIKLSDRLRAIADFVKIGESMADIGTDHGFLPIYLWEEKISPKVILSDINEGPLKKATENIREYNKEASKKIIIDSEDFFIRKGSGIETLEAGEVDDIIVAGMGGNLIIDILALDLNKSKSFKKLILQPRKTPEKLKKWLFSVGFAIIDEILVKEGKYIWEIIVAVPGNSSYIYDFENEHLSKLKHEISPILITKKDPLLLEFIERKLAINTKILKSIKHNETQINKIADLEAYEKTLELFAAHIKGEN